jgi:hypothetical protein
MEIPPQAFFYPIPSGNGQRRGHAIVLAGDMGMSFAFG